MPEEPSLPDKIVALVDALSAAGIAHALGGAIALAYYAAPRGTDDVDINVFVSVDAHPDVRSAITLLGVDVVEASPQLTKEGQVRAWWGRTPVDVFYSNLPFHKAMKRATRVVPFADRQVRIISPEHLVVCKAAVDRPQDWVDIENLLAATPVNRVEVDRWAGDVLGTSDRRHQRLLQLEIDALGPS